MMGRETKDEGVNNCLSGQSEKRFFFEKKKQKTFIIWRCHHRERKVFGSFFKKTAFFDHEN
jgi:hypothetical protein